MGILSLHSLSVLFLHTFSLAIFQIHKCVASYCWNWKGAALLIYNPYCQNCIHIDDQYRSHQKILTYIIVYSCYIDNIAKHFHCLVHEQWHKDFPFWWYWHVHWCKNVLLRDELRILNKLHDFAGNPWCCAVCTNCSEKCTYYFANFKNDSKNVPKRLRKTVIEIWM